jgi:hypothetical protein
MKTKFTLLLLTVFGAVCFAQEDTAPTNELAFGLGGIPALSRSNTPSVDAGSGVAFPVNYGRRFLNGSRVALYGEINFVQAFAGRLQFRHHGDSELRQSLSHAWNSGGV